MLKRIKDKHGTDRVDAEEIKKRWKEYTEELYKKDLNEPDQYKEIEENNSMGKTRDLFKKMRDIRGTFHAKKGSIKDRNGRHLIDSDEIKKRWKEYMEELY